METSILIGFMFLTGMISGALTVVVLLEARYRKTSIQYAKPDSFKTKTSKASPLKLAKA